MTENTFFTTKLNLRRLMLLLTFFSVLVTLGNGYYSAYRVEKELLIENTLESNQVYANKLASITDQFLFAVIRQLHFSATILSRDLGDHQTVSAELDRLILQDDLFSSVSVVDNQGKLLHSMPYGYEPLVLPLNNIYPFNQEGAFISLPYDNNGHSSISINYPMFGGSGTYLGYLAGEVYLNVENALNILFSKHSYHDGTYLFVVGHNNRVLYHGSDIKDNLEGVALTNLVSHMKGQSGSFRFKKEDGEEMLVGYAYVPHSAWWVVNMKPTHDTLEKLQQHMERLVIKGLPLTLITLALIWLSAVYISRPLRQLAIQSHYMHKENAHRGIQSIFSWYAEASQLKYAILKGIDALNAQIAGLKHEKDTDHMTQLYNRRGMEWVLSVMHAERKEFAIILLDIDHFKKVNDTFGHETGDRVICDVAKQMRQTMREADMLCRMGGEEFAIFLPNTDLQSAKEIAERLREAVETHTFPNVEKVTISLGVTLSVWQNSDQRYSSSIRRADSALYKAKQLGRNQTVVIEK